MTASAGTLNRGRRTSGSRGLERLGFTFDFAFTLGAGGAGLRSSGLAR